MNISAKKILSALLAAVMLGGALASCENTGKPAESGTETKAQTEGEKPSFDYDPARTLFVSTDGDDTSDGTWEHPLASLGGAKKAVKELLESGDGGVTVYFRGGNYPITQTVFFDGSDSGSSADAPVVYKAYNGETVTMNAGKKIAPSAIESAADSWVASLMRDPEQAKDLLVVDLSGEKQLPGFRAKFQSGDYHGKGMTCPFSLDDGAAKSPELFLGDTPTERARWPEDGMMVEFPGNTWTENDDADTYDGSTKSRNVYLSEEILDRAEGWSDKSAEYLYMVGMVYCQFYYESFKPLAFNREDGSLKLRTSMDGWDMSNARAYFLNIPEELDVPGESYLDEGEGKLYFLPTDDYDPENVWYSGLDSNIVRFNGTKNVTFEGIDFKYSRDTAIVGAMLENFALIDCDVMHTSNYGVYLDGTGILLSGCEIGDTNNTCVYVAGGDDKTLTSGECVIENCYIHSCGRNRSNFGKENLITSYSTGNVIRNCELSDSFAAAINPYANQLLVEYCDIHDVMQYAGDYGAIYWNTIAHNFGYVIRYNTFHEIGNPWGMGHQCIYHDGVGMGAEICNNLFYNIIDDGEQWAEGCIKLGQAQFSKINNNIFVDCGKAVWNANLSDPGIQMMIEACTPYSWEKESNFKKLYDIGFDSDLWRETFSGKHQNGNLFNYLKPGDLEALVSITDEKEISKYLRQHKDMIPTGENVCENNIFVSVRQEILGSEWMRDKAKSNYYDKDGENTAIFVDYENDNFALTEEGLKTIRETIPDFAELPLDKIGRTQNN